jgi:hypothetical protein
MSAPTAEESVRVLLAAAGLTVTDEEFAQFVADYPAHRADLDALYAVPMAKEEEPQTIFSPYV